LLHEKHPNTLRPVLRDRISAIVIAVEDPKEKLIKQLRKLIIEEWLDKMQRTNLELCPVDMTLTTYKTAASYMTTK
jgi:hypothetical protein